MRYILYIFPILINMCLTLIGTSDFIRNTLFIVSCIFYVVLLVCLETHYEYILHINENFFSRLDDSMNYSRQINTEYFFITLVMYVLSYIDMKIWILNTLFESTGFSIFFIILYILTIHSKNKLKKEIFIELAKEKHKQGLYNITKEA